MAQKEVWERKFRNIDFRCSVRPNYIIFPIDGFELINALERAGYTIRVPIPLKPSPVPSVRLSFAGTLAQKGEIMVDGNAERGYLGVTGKSYASAIRGLSEVKEIVKEALKVDLNEGVRFHEIMAHFDLDSEQCPLEKIAQVFSGNEFLRKVDSILEQETSFFTLRFVSRGKVPNQEEWLDITIEPDLIKATTSYSISAVYRSADVSKFEKFGEQLESRILKLIDEIEAR